MCSVNIPESQEFDKGRVFKIQSFSMNNFMVVFQSCSYRSLRMLTIQRHSFLEVYKGYLEWSRRICLKISQSNRVIAPATLPSDIERIDLALKQIEENRYVICTRCGGEIGLLHLVKNLGTSQCACCMTTA